MGDHQRLRLTCAAPLLLALGLAPVACSPPASDSCAGIDCGEFGTCLVVGGASRCDCAQGYVQVGSRCQPVADGGVDGQIPCGDGVAVEGEVCDGEDLRGQTCDGLGFIQGGTLGCRSTCDYFDTSGCLTDCGDGLVGGTESCDGSDLNNEDCESLGFYSGDLTCLGSCQYNIVSCSGSCGDGIINFGHEVCDGTNLGMQGCSTVGFHTGSLACDSCEHDVSGCQYYCGDGIYQQGYESCEGSDLGGATCASERYSFGTLTCSTDCELDTSGCESVCGDGVLNTGEECDDGNTVAGDGCSADCSAALGRIVFVSDRDGRNELWTMTDDGSNLAQITDLAASAADCDGAHSPRWSPDGSRIVFRLGGEGGSGCGAAPELWVVDADGSNELLVAPADIRGGITWTRDGSQIVYTSDGLTLRVVADDGTGDATLYDGLGQELDPDFHPFLDRILFSQFAGGGDYLGIFSVDTDGSDLLQLAGQCVAGCGLRSARWSSNGARVLYHRDGGIFWVSADATQDGTVQPSGAGLHLDWVTDNLVVYQTPSASADLILFNLTDTTSQDLTADGSYNGEPDWHPGQRDTDLDGVLDWEDNCVNVPNPKQYDIDQDGAGNLCD